MLLTLFYRWSRRVRAFFLAGTAQPIGRPASNIARLNAGACSTAALRTAVTDVAPLAGVSVAIAPTMQLSVEVTRV